MRKSLLVLLGAFFLCGAVLVGCDNTVEPVKPEPSPTPTPSVPTDPDPEPTPAEPVLIGFDTRIKVGNHIGDSITPIVLEATNSSGIMKFKVTLCDLSETEFDDISTIRFQLSNVPNDMTKPDRPPLATLTEKNGSVSLLVTAKKDFTFELQATDEKGTKLTVSVQVKKYVKQVFPEGGVVLQINGSNCVNDEFYNANSDSSPIEVTLRAKDGTYLRDYTRVTWNLGFDNVWDKSMYYLSNTKGYSTNIYWSGSHPSGDVISITCTDEDGNKILCRIAF